MQHTQVSPYLAISPSFGLFLVGFGVGEEPTAVVFFPELTLENLVRLDVIGWWSRSSIVLVRRRAYMITRHTLIQL